MKVFWASNAPFISSGYGNQTDLFTRRLKEAGHDVVVFGTFGHYGPTMNAGGIQILPSSLDQYGNDILEAHVETYKPDVAVMLYDAWVLKPEALRHLTLWAPVDHETLPPLVEERLGYAKQVWAMSRHGERAMRAAGLDPFYVPHGVDTAVYRPVNRAEARRVCGIAPGVFLAVMVAANKGYPARKSFDRVLKAWAQFIERHPESQLYIHALPSDAQGGLDLIECARWYGIPERNLRFPDLYRLIRNDYSHERMNALYNAADVLVSPSMGEGFGIPVIEAQAAGCPVIVSDFTAQAELGAAGYRIPIHDDDRVYTLYGAEQALVRPGEIVRGLEWALENRGNEALRTAALGFATDYDASVVFGRYMLPALRACAGQTAPVPSAGNITVIAEPEAVLNPACKDGHDWAAVGVWDEGILCFPCKRAGCPAERRISQDGRETSRETGFEMAVFDSPDAPAGVPLDIEDDPEGGVAKIICREVSTSYRLGEIAFAPGDVALDIGAHVGIVSITLAKLHPEIRIIAYEPIPANFARLQRNLQANGVTNVEAVNLALSGDGRDLLIAVSAGNTGGNSAYIHANGNGVTVPSRTLAQVFEAHGIERLTLLKIDCEGAEYEILLGGAHLLSRVAHLRGEIHINQHLRAHYRLEGFQALLQERIPDVVAHVCEIAE